jgi:hypothetical protein
MNTSRNIVVGIAMPVVALFLGALVNARPLGNPPEPSDVTITVSRFSFIPKQIYIAIGERIRLTVISDDLDYRLAIKDFDIHQTVKAKQTTVIELTPDREGRFPVLCSATDGGDSRIVGELTVAGAPSESQRMKVTFDPSIRGVVVVESAGERLRIDTTTNTIQRISDVATASAPKPAQEPARQTSIKDSASGKTSEPYDYHIVNIPTPKAVRRHSLNMNFTHRFQETITPFESEDASEHIARISKDLLGLDSSAVSSFGVTYGITDRLYANVYRSPLCQPGLCKTIELGLGYHFLDEAGKSPIALSAYSSVEGDYNFTERYTYNFQVMIGRSISRYVNMFFSPAAHINANGGNRFKEFLSAQPLISSLRLGRHSGSFGFGLNARVRPSTSLLFEYTPRVGFKLGQLTPVFDSTIGQLTGFKNESEAEIGFGIEKRIGRHVFSLTFSNTQTTTTSRYNSSNLALPPSKFSIGFNLFRRLL